MRISKFAWLFILILTVSCSAAAPKKGPYADSIYFDVRMQEEIGIQDTIAGKTDLFYYGLNGPSVKGLNRSSLNKLDLYAIPSGSWSFLFNPYPNAAPYLVKNGASEQFNPFAIRQVRYWMNWLINRQYIADEILAGTGEPMFTMGTPGQPGVYKYNMIPIELGMVPEGNEKKAVAQIEALLTQASKLGALRNKLKKNGRWWTFDGKPVTVKFLIRVDDPNGRLKEGQYVANQIEKTGIKVERLLWDRSKCVKTAYYSNPADYQWNIYTEAYSAGETRAFWDQIVCQMYAPFFGNMPGGGEGGNWNYQNKQLDELAKKANTGNVLNQAEYWDAVIKAQELGLEDSVRIYVVDQFQYFVANKNRFKRRFAYGLGDGLNRWSLITARTKKPTLRATQYSAKGALFMSAWDPVGVDGFNDMYSNYLAEPLFDVSMFNHPVTAKVIPNRAVPVSTVSKVHKNGGKVVGDIPVAAKAIIWDSKAKRWTPVAPGTTAISKVVYKFKFSKYHHGIPMSLNDYLYADAFIRDWAARDQPNDPTYDESYSAYWKPKYDAFKGMVYDFKNQTITNYFNYNFPADRGMVQMYGAPDIMVTASGHYNAVSWEIIEAMARMVSSRKSASGAIYSFNPSKEGTTQVDVLRPTCVKDIQAELKKMKRTKYVPLCLKGHVKAVEAVKRYDAALKFIAQHHHAFISNGPYYLDKFDNKANYALLKAFRDPSYPFTPDYWIKKFKATVVTVEKMDIPAVNQKVKEVTVKIYVSQSAFPDDAKIAAVKGNVKLLLLAGTDEYTIQAKRIKAGLFTATIPAATVNKLKSGSYTIIASAESAGFTSSRTGTLIVY